MRLITPLLLVIVAILAGFFVTKPLYEDITTLRGDISQYKQAIEKGKAFNEKLKVLVDARNALAPEDVARLSKMIPDTIDPARLIIELDTLAKKAGTAGIHTIKTADAKATEASSRDDRAGVRLYDSVPVNFVISATYEQFTQFLKGVESNLRLIDITALTFVPSETSSVYDFSVTVRTYWLKPLTQ